MLISVFRSFLFIISPFLIKAITMYLKRCIIFLFSVLAVSGIQAKGNKIKLKPNPKAQEIDTTNIDELIKEIEFLKAQQLYFNEAESLIMDSPVEVTAEESTTKYSITDSSIYIPDGMEDNLNSLLSDWFVRNHTYQDSTCVSSYDDMACSDEEYIARLAAMPCIIDMPYNSVIKQYIELYVKKRRSLVEYMLGLGNYYFPVFEEVLNKYDMPHELKYLPVIESALKATAKSKAGAMGLWQFMLPTGKIMGLEINSLVDERCDVYKSTDAAARYLKQLYGIYKDWHLAIAAYNCGPGNVNKAIRRSGGKRNYWDIYFHLPKETRGYVPAFIAATYAMTYHCEHNLCPVMTHLPNAVDTVNVDKMVHFQQISDFLGISVEEIRILNPQYTKDIVPGNVAPSPLKLPVQHLYTFIDNQDTIMLHKSEELLVNNTRIVSVGSGGRTYSAGERTHKVRSGETLSSIAKKYSVTVESIKRANGLKNNNLRVGQNLAIAGGNAKSTSGTASAAVKKAVTNGNYEIYKVKEGDNLWSIANRYAGISADNIKEANQLKNNNLKVGQSLKIPAI